MSHENISINFSYTTLYLDDYYAELERVYQDNPSELIQRDIQNHIILHDAFPSKKQFIITTMQKNH